MEISSISGSHELLFLQRRMLLHEISCRTAALSLPSQPPPGLTQKLTVARSGRSDEHTGEKACGKRNRNKFIKRHRCYLENFFGGLQGQILLYFCTLPWTHTLYSPREDAWFFTLKLWQTLLQWMPCGSCFSQTHLWPGPCAPGCTLSPVAGLTAVRLLCKGHTLSVVHNTLGVLTIKCYTVNRASLGASTTGSWAGSPLPCFPPAGHRIKQTNNGPTKLLRGTEVSAVSMLQSDKENISLQNRVRDKFLFHQALPSLIGNAKHESHSRGKSPATKHLLLWKGRALSEGKIYFHGFWSPNICKNIMPRMEH